MSDRPDEGVPAKAVYSPSPRPTFEVPSLITRQGVTRHIWGDDEAGQVADWIYASTERVHALVFGLAPGHAFRHSREFRTVFGADEVLYVLSGTMVLANPETGEVARVATGESVTFGPDTWHHAFAHGGEPLRVLELFAPPPSAGTSGAYARTKPYLETSRYADDAVLGHVPGTGEERAAFRVVRDEDIIWRRDLGVLAGLQLSTDHITIHTLELDSGQASTEHRHGGDELLFLLRGEMWVRAWQDGKAYVFELGPEDACFLPAGCEHEYRVYGAGSAEAMVGIAPSYLP
jgi:quercetin dioxygenase-like cupin family protein